MKRMQRPDDQRRGPGPPKRSRQGEQRVCSFFAAGYCRKGTSCDFLHVRDGASGEEYTRERRGAGHRPRNDVGAEPRGEGAAGTVQRSPFGALKGLSRQPKLLRDEDVSCMGKVSAHRVSSTARGPATRAPKKIARFRLRFQ